MIMTETKWFIAYDTNKNIYHYGFAQKGTDFTTGQPEVEFFTSREDLINKLDELGVDHGGEFEDLPDRGELLATLDTRLDVLKDKYAFAPIDFLGKKVIADEKAQGKVSNVLFALAQFGIVDDNQIATSGWDCEDGVIENITVGQLKGLGTIMFQQEQSARQARRETQEQLSTLLVEELAVVDVEQLFVSNL